MSYESVVEYICLSRQRIASVVTYIGLYRRSYESVVKHVCFYLRRREILQLADFQEMQALEKVAPAVKVTVWDLVFRLWAAKGPCGSFENVMNWPALLLTSG